MTSGGDAPGMNAAIRAVVRTALGAGAEVFGVRHGYAGLIDGDFVSLSPRSVGGIIQQGGTVLGTSRAPEFSQREYQLRAVASLERAGIEGLVVVGGNGSQSGALALHRLGVAVAGVASTIDNDLAGVDVTLGVDTALNVVLEAIDRLKVTASSHHRAFLVEVMGRDSGYLALMAGIAGGAECIVVPEVETAPHQVAEELRLAYERGKAHAIAVVAEGARHGSEELIAYFRERRSELGFELRSVILGHVQRGGAPGSFDRLLGTRLGAAASEGMLCGERGVLYGLSSGKVTALPLEQVVGVNKELDLGLFDLARSLAT